LPNATVRPLRQDSASCFGEILRQAPLEANRTVAKSHRWCFTAEVQLNLFRSLRGQQPRPPATLAVGAHSVPVLFVRNPRARRYILRIDTTGAVRVTLPSRGSQAEAWDFARRNTSWITRHIEQRLAQPPRPTTWGHGAELLFRGDIVRLSISANHSANVVEFAGQRIVVALETDVRRAVELHLWNLAWRELTARTAEFAIRHSLAVRRITVRNQRSRWGSCSRRGTISLNWRLIQAPAHVRDYIILHELMHLREHNHSSRFWKHVEGVCSDHAVAEKWLKQNRQLLGSAI
jgi:predicted metal-dependent hydrolase